MAVQDCPIIESIGAPVDLPLLLSTQLDLGEASVIHTAISRNIPKIVIDEKLGRRIAQLHNLKVTGSIGVLIKAVRLSVLSDLNGCFDKMEQKRIWISQALKEQALRTVGSH